MTVWYIVTFSLFDYFISFYQYVVYLFFLSVYGTAALFFVCYYILLCVVILRSLQLCMKRGSAIRHSKKITSSGFERNYRANNHLCEVVFFYLKCWCVWHTLQIIPNQRLTINEFFVKKKFINRPSLPLSQCELYQNMDFIEWTITM